MTLRKPKGEAHVAYSDLGATEYDQIGHLISRDKTDKCVLHSYHNGTVRAIREVNRALARIGFQLTT